MCGRRRSPTRSCGGASGARRAAWTSCNRLLEKEGAAEAERIAREGVALAAASGWEARPLADRTLGAEGFALARLAEELGPARWWSARGG